MSAQFRTRTLALALFGVSMLNLAMTARGASSAAEAKDIDVAVVYSYNPDWWAVKDERAGFLDALRHHGIPEDRSGSSVTVGHHPSVSLHLPSRSPGRLRIYEFHLDAKRIQAENGNVDAAAQELIRQLTTLSDGGVQWDAFVTFDDAALDTIVNSRRFRNLIVGLPTHGNYIPIISAGINDSKAVSIGPDESLSLEFDRSSGTSPFAVILIREQVPLRGGLEFLRDVLDAAEPLDPILFARDHPHSSLEHPWRAETYRVLLIGDTSLSMDALLREFGTECEKVDRVECQFERPPGDSPIGSFEWLEATLANEELLGRYHAVSLYIPWTFSSSTGEWIDQDEFFEYYRETVIPRLSGFAPPIVDLAHSKIQTKCGYLFAAVDDLYDQGVLAARELVAQLQLDSVNGTASASSLLVTGETGLGWDVQLERAAASRLAFSEAPVASLQRLEAAEQVSLAAGWEINLGRAATINMYVPVRVLYNFDAYPRALDCD